MNNNKLLELKDVVTLKEFAVFSEPINWTIKDNEHWAVIGPNGAGKTLLIDILCGKYSLKSGKIIKDTENINFIKTVTFRDIYSLSNIQNSYYQQRWNKGLEEDTTPVSEILEKESDKDCINTLISTFNIGNLMEKNISLLSSGELRKFLIVKSLALKPRILILDNPFIGLDSNSRKILTEVLGNLSKIRNLQIILVVPSISDIPQMITHILSVKNKHILSSDSYSNFINNSNLQHTLFSKDFPIPSLIVNKNENPDFSDAIICSDINIKYEQKNILKNLSWKVKKGEKWALLGENGSGKSTLLSLINGDNPQAYANNITLFDRKKNSGENIWDIKKRIGYISPEMHLYYLKNISCLKVVCSGFFDSIGFYNKCSVEQEKIALEWMKVFGIESIKDTSFLTISNGEQRLALLARVFVKNPDLLILDEPLHGLDSVNKNRVKKIIELYCNQEKTLIYVTHYLDEIPNVVNKHLTLSK